MKEKEKGKSHPFAGHLRPTEEVLWAGPPDKRGIGMSLLRIYGGMLSLPLIFGLCLSPCFLVMAIAKVKFDAHMLLAILIALPVYSTCMFIPILLLGLLSALIRFIRRTPPRPTYAITNERLLCRQAEAVHSVPLESLEMQVFLQSDSYKGEIDFGALFPSWTQADSPRAARRIIEDAREKRLAQIQRPV